MKSLRALVPVVVVALALLASACSASALTRVVSPTGSGTDCSDALPCNIKYAVDTASGSPFDIKVLPGTYGNPGTPTLNLGASGRDDTVISAADPTQRPLLYISTSSANYGLIVTSGALNDLDIVMPPTATPLYGIYTGEMNRVSVLGRASNGSCLAMRIRNSLCANTVGAGFVFSASASGPVDYPIEFTNSTFWGGPTSYGADIAAGAEANIDVSMRNSIVRGGIGSLGLQTNGVGVSDIDVIAAHSSFSGIDLSGAGASATSCAINANQCAAPVLVDPANGNYRQSAGSPTIGAGDPAAAVGTTDVAGLPRIVGGRVDIGAYQDQTAPPVYTKLTALKSKSKTFRIAKSGAAFKAASKQPKTKKGKKPVGTIVSFNLSQADSVVFTLQRAYVGRKSGSSCVKKSRKNAAKKKCTFYRAMKGTETVSGAAGSNRVWWTGRWKGKALSTTGAGYALKGTPIKASSGDEPGTLSPRPIKPIKF